MEMYCVFHKKYYIREENKEFVYFGVNEAYKKSYGEEVKVILENELEKYNPYLQKRGYMETSAYLHVYWNKLYEKKEMIGFCQYDMKHKSSYEKMEKEIYILNAGSAIVKNGKWDKMMFAEIRNLDYLIESYNKHFKKEYSKKELEGMPLSLWQTNVYPVKIYEKLCSWLEVLVEEIYPWSNEAPYESHFGSIGGYTERALSIFNGFEIYEGCKYKNLNIENNVNNIAEQYNKKMFMNNYSFDIHSKQEKLNKYNDKIWEKIELSYEEQTYVRGKPLKYLNETIELFNKMNGKVILEIGSCRSRMNHKIDEFNPRCCNDGHSTYFWKMKTNAEIYTVDIDSNCKEIIENDNRLVDVKSFTEDAIEFGRNFGKEIDLLFLDAWDVNPGEPYAEKHVEMYETIKPKLSEKCMILIDDTDILNGGKGKELFTKLLEDGYNVLFKGRQTLFIKSNMKKVREESDGEKISLIRKEINDITKIYMVIENKESKAIALIVDDSIVLNKIENILNENLKEYEFYYNVMEKKIDVILTKEKKIICKWEITYSKYV